MTAGSRCPRCGSALAAATTRSVQLLACGSCGGVWLDNHSTRKVIDVLCDDTVHRADAIARFAQRPADRAPTIACPTCSQKLARWSVPEANVDVDWCADHGTWFDRDELATVARAYATRRAYGVGGVAVAAGAAVAVSVAANDPSIQQRAREVADNVDVEVAADVALTAVDFVDPADVVEGAGVAAEGAFEIFGALGEILGGL